MFIKKNLAWLLALTPLWINPAGGAGEASQKTPAISGTTTVSSPEGATPVAVVDSEDVPWATFCSSSSEDDWGTRATQSSGTAASTAPRATNTASSGRPPVRLRVLSRIDDSGYRAAAAAAVATTPHDSSAVPETGAGALASTTHATLTTVANSTFAGRGGFTSGAASRLPDRHDYLLAAVPRGKPATPPRDLEAWLLSESEDDDTGSSDSPRQTRPPASQSSAPWQGAAYPWAGAAATTLTGGVRGLGGSERVPRRPNPSFGTPATGLSAEEMATLLDKRRSLAASAIRPDASSVYSGSRSGISRYSAASRAPAASSLLPPSLSAIFAAMPEQGDRRREESGGAGGGSQKGYFIDMRPPPAAAAAAAPEAPPTTGDKIKQFVEIQEIALTRTIDDPRARFSELPTAQGPCYRPEREWEKLNATGLRLWGTNNPRTKTKRPPVRMIELSSVKATVQKEVFENGSLESPPDVQAELLQKALVKTKPCILYALDTIFQRRGFTTSEQERVSYFTSLAKLSGRNVRLPVSDYILSEAGSCFAQRFLYHLFSAEFIKESLQGLSDTRPIREKCPSDEDYALKLRHFETFSEPYENECLAYTLSQLERYISQFFARSVPSRKFPLSPLVSSLRSSSGHSSDGGAAGGAGRTFDDAADYHPGPMTALTVGAAGGAWAAAAQSAMYPPLPAHASSLATSPDLERERAVELPETLKYFDTQQQKSLIATFGDVERHYGKDVMITFNRACLPGGPEHFFRLSAWHHLLAEGYEVWGQRPADSPSENEMARSLKRMEMTSIFLRAVDDPRANPEATVRSAVEASVESLKAMTLEELHQRAGFLAPERALVYTRELINSFLIKPSPRPAFIDDFYCFFAKHLLFHLTFVRYQEEVKDLIENYYRYQKELMGKEKEAVTHYHTTYLIPYEEGCLGVIKEALANAIEGAFKT